MRKRVLISIALALLLMSVGIGSFWILGSTFARPEQSGVARTPAYKVSRPDEQPVSMQRAVSMMASQAATALLPWGIAIDRIHGFIWVAEPGCEPKPKCPSATQGILGQYALSDGAFIANYYEPAGYTGPLFVAVDTDGNVWFTQPTSDALGKFDPQRQVWSQWPLKRGSAPFDLVFDSSGRLWFTEFGGNNIGFFDPRTQKKVETPVPTANSNPYGIAVDPRGTVWFTENGAGVDQIGSFTPTASGAITIMEHAVGTLRPHLIATDQAGNIWYSGGFDGDIGKFDPHTGKSSSFVVYHGACASPTNCTGTHISGIFVDGKGNVWFTDSLSQRVGYLIPATGQVVARTLPVGNAHPYDGLVVDDWKRVWFTEEYALRLTMWPVSIV